MTLRVLLAEDDPDIQRVARFALRRADFDVVIVTNGIEALEWIGTHGADVILLDWMMPDMDGLETCTRLKADPATRDIPVIFLTAESQEAEISRGLELGAAGYITKPFDALSLGVQVRALLDNRS